VDQTRTIDKVTQLVTSLTDRMTKIEKSIDQSNAQRRPGEAISQYAVDKAFNPMREADGTKALVSFGGYQTSLVDFGDSYKVPTGSRSKSLGYHDAWRALYASNGNMLGVNCPNVVGWTKNDPPPDQFIKQKGFRPSSQRWGRHKASMAEGQGATGG
jgi:hypothetical protein